MNYKIHTIQIYIMCSYVYMYYNTRRIPPKMVLGQKPPRQKATGQKPPGKSSPTISPRYKSPKKTKGWIFFLGFVDPSRDRLASTSYFAIISSIILGNFLAEGFCLGGFLSGAFCRGLLTGYPQNDQPYFQILVKLTRLYICVFGHPPTVSLEDMHTFLNCILSNLGIDLPSVATNKFIRKEDIFGIFAIFRLLCTIYLKNF